MKETLEHMKKYMQEQRDEVKATKDMLKLTLTILSKFSHCQQLTDEEKQIFYKRWI